MKKLMNKFNFAIIGLMASMAPSMAAVTEESMNKALCDLATQLGGVFNVLRTLAFVGAGFIIAGWAWGWIAAGEVKFDEVKKRGIGLLVGFVLLFGVGAILSAFMNMAGEGGSLGCAASMFGGK